MTTTTAAILARLADVIGTTQTTDTPDGGVITATLVVRPASGLGVNLSYADAAGRERAIPQAVYDDLTSYSDTDEIEEAIKGAFPTAGGRGVSVALDWRETHALVRVSVEVDGAVDEHRTSGGAQVRLVASTEHDGVEVRLVIGGQGHDGGSCSLDDVAGDRDGAGVLGDGDDGVDASRDDVLRAAARAAWALRNALAIDSAVGGGA